MNADELLERAKNAMNTPDPLLGRCECGGIRYAIEVEYAQNRIVITAKCFQCKAVKQVDVGKKQ